MKTSTRRRQLSKLYIRQLSQAQLNSIEAGRKKEQFRSLAGGMFDGMIEGLAEIHRDSPELLTVLAG